MRAGEVSASEGLRTAKVSFHWMGFDYDVPNVLIKVFSCLLQHPDYKQYTTNLILLRTASEWGLVRV